MRLDTEIATSKGVCKCTIKRSDKENEFEVDLWRGDTFLNSSYTVFSAAVNLRWDGVRYVIIRHRKEQYTNEYWLELEKIISKVIILNS